MKKAKSNYSELEIMGHIQKWFVDNHDIEVLINDRYIDSGTIDSFDMINLISYIESKYNFKFTSNDFQDIRFFTLDGLSKMIMEKKADV